MSEEVKLYKTHGSKRSLGTIKDGNMKFNKTGWKWYCKNQETFSCGYVPTLHQKGKIRKIDLNMTFE
jgi:hypothetical protein